MGPTSALSQKWAVGTPNRVSRRTAERSTSATARIKAAKSTRHTWTLRARRIDRETQAARRCVVARDRHVRLAPGGRTALRVFPRRAVFHHLRTPAGLGLRRSAAAGAAPRGALAIVRAFADRATRGVVL